VSAAPGVRFRHWRESVGECVVVAVRGYRVTFTNSRGRRGTTDLGLWITMARPV